MSDAPEARLMLPDETTREQFRSIARGHGWVQYTVHDLPGGSYEEVWTSADRAAALHYVEDVAISRERFLRVRSDRLRGPLPEILPEIASAFRTIPIRTLCTTIIHSKDIAERIRAVTRLGVVAFEITAQVRVAWEIGLFHPDPHLRLATLRALSFLGSPQLIPMLQEVARHDLSDRARQDAGELIDAIRRRAAHEPANDSAVSSPG
jgi:hypothetical protein